MNSCILMAEIYDAPQLRHTPDGLEITEMIVHVAGLRPDDPTHPLKVVSWGNLAKEIHQNYHPGDRVILEGRLGMNTFERPEGFKEKRAELTIQRIHAVSKGVPTNQPAPQRPLEIVNHQPSRSAQTPTTTFTNPAPQPTTPEPVYQPVSSAPPSYQPTTEAEPDPDDIPF
ncbi:single-stranded DNA-binding protein [Sphaerospermopsis torques-reginae]|uniref:Single-stranded DNA-binding protein n=1 Tax=Sphaerospermopsis torques-reginae ITEP-024 TaxID=984208 RepID=A0ABX8WV53_9CYAN|nr:single-stranded DNA-binding protein [Sphaerospermopsis torques-reginae]QYX30303.1 single-stranded DNA-binding protein [Sphaerospermopsis torques-reginae ITEP-024]